MEFIDQLAEKSKYIIREANAQFSNVCVLFSTGKDSTLLLYLIKEAFPKGVFPFSVYQIDTKMKYPEMYKFRDYISKEWDIPIGTFTYKDIIENTSPEKDVFECCNLRKTETLKRAIKEIGFDAVITGIRWDEMAERGVERFFSPRKGGSWELLREKMESEEGDSPFEYLQDMEMSGWDLYASDYGEECDHVRIHPLLHWTELDVWKYIKKYNLPVNPLYFSKGGKRYRSLGCMPCTYPIDSKASNIDEIIEELEKNLKSDDFIEERSGRNLDKEKIQRRLRALGYM